MLLIRNLKQKRFSKKMSHKYVESFRTKNKSKTQIYRLILFNIYRIYRLILCFTLEVIFALRRRRTSETNVASFETY